MQTWDSQRNQIFHKRVQTKIYYWLHYQRNPGIFCRTPLLKFPGVKQIIQIRINTTSPTNSEYSMLKPIVPEGLLSASHPREHKGSLSVLTLCTLNGLTSASPDLPETPDGV